MSSLDKLSAYAGRPLLPVVESGPVPGVTPSTVLPASEPVPSSLTCAAVTIPTAGALAVPGAPTDVGCASAQQIAERLLKTFARMSHTVAISATLARLVQISGDTRNNDGTQHIIMQVKSIGTVHLDRDKDRGLRLRSTEFDLSLPAHSHAVWYIWFRALGMRLEFSPHHRGEYVHLPNGVSYTNAEMRTLDTTAVENRYTDALLIMRESISARYTELMLPQKHFRTFNESIETREKVAQKLSTKPSLRLSEVVKAMTDKLADLENKVRALQVP